MLQKSKRWSSFSSEPRSHTAMKVIDRTGPKPRELSSYEEIYDRPLRPDDKLPGEPRERELPVDLNLCCECRGQYSLYARAAP